MMNIHCHATQSSLFSKAARTAEITHHTDSAVLYTDITNKIWGLTEIKFSTESDIWLKLKNPLQGAHTRLQLGLTTACKFRLQILVPTYVIAIPKSNHVTKFCYLLGFTLSLHFTEKYTT
jgi:hypothetical protein